MTSTAIPESVKKVSIIIPVKNRLDMTLPCLKSLWSHGGNREDVEVILVDDASTDGTAQQVQQLYPSIRIIGHAESQGYAKCNNEAARLATGTFLCLLNNDTLLTDGWLDGLVHAAETIPDVGIVGNKQLWPNTTKVNHAGMVFGEDNLPVHLYPGEETTSKLVNVARDFQSVTAACLLIARKLFLQLGGFDEKFVNGYEDVDLCLRVRQAGKRVWYTPDSVIYHYGQSSPGRTERETNNRLYFQTKWRGRVLHDQYHYTFSDTKAAPPRATAKGLRTATRDKICINVPLARPSSFAWVASRLALAMQENGVKLCIQTPSVDGSMGTASEVKRLRGLSTATSNASTHITWTHYSDPYLTSYPRADLVAEMFATNYEYSQVASKDVDFWSRHIQRNGHFKLPISRFCDDVLAQLGVPASHRRVIPLGYSPEIDQLKGDGTRSSHAPITFLAVTNSHDLYRYGTDILLKAMSERFRGRKDIRLIIKDYGASSGNHQLKHWLRSFDGPSVEVIDRFLSKQELLDLYQSADFFLAPFRGEGFAMKVLDACAIGIPVIAPRATGPADYLNDRNCLDVPWNPVSVGECYDRECGIVPPGARWVEPTVDGLAATLATAIERHSELRASAQTDAPRIRKDFSWHVVAERVVAALNDFQATRANSGLRIQAQPAEKTISMVMPTYNRPEQLRRTLDIYKQQSVGRDQFEIVVVDDGSRDARINQQIVQEASAALDVSFHSLDVNQGPAAARNRGVEVARGSVIAFVGDDVEPEADMVEQHIRFHKQNSDATAAMLGYVYHPKDYCPSRMMDYTTTFGGQQFHYSVLKPGQAPFGYFYTCNVSVKRSMLIAEQNGFYTGFRKAAWEDVEYAYRLSERGMQLYFNPAARGAHVHFQSHDDVLRRQYTVGRMALCYFERHPQLLDGRIKDLIEWMQAFSLACGREPEIAADCCDLGRSGLDFLANMIRFRDRLDTLGDPCAGENATERRVLGVSRDHGRNLDYFLRERVCALKVLHGMADEWAGVESSEANPLRDFLSYQMLAELLSRRGFASVAGGVRLLQIVRRVRAKLPIDRVAGMLIGPERFKKVVRRVRRMVVGEAA
jgi:GT2 family glycosyltransferase/glycosyltransferase involved in cell wall biosynthesis